MNQTQSRISSERPSALSSRCLESTRFSRGSTGAATLDAWLEAFQRGATNLEQWRRSLSLDRKQVPLRLAMGTRHPRPRPPDASFLASLIPTRDRRQKSAVPTTPFLDRLPPYHRTLRPSRSPPQSTCSCVSSAALHVSQRFSLHYGGVSFLRAPGIWQSPVRRLPRLRYTGKLDLMVFPARLGI